MELSCSAALLAAPHLPAKASSGGADAASLASGNSVFFRNGGSGLSSKRRLTLVSRRTGNGGRSTSRGLGCRCLFGLGVPELVVIAGVAALVFGPRKLPEVGRSIGKTVKSFQQAAKEFETELKKEPEAAVEAPATEKPKAVSSDDEKKELETLGQKESA